MSVNKKIRLAGFALLTIITIFLFIVWQSSYIHRIPYKNPNPSYTTWEDILAHPGPIEVKTYSTGTMATNLSGIMNLDHEKAVGFTDRIVHIPVNVGLVRHEQHGDYLVDAGLDASYVSNPNGTITGVLAKKFLGKGKQEPGNNIAAFLNYQNIHPKGVFLTHLHPDHTAGIVDLSKDIIYYAGSGERYMNFRFIMHTRHFNGISDIYEIGFSDQIEIPPFGRCVDIFGDGTFWAIESSGHSKGHVMYLVNGIKEQVLLTGDACNDQLQFDTGVGPGYYSSDTKKAQHVLETIIEFNKQHPNVRLSFGHE